MDTFVIIPMKKSTTLIILGLVSLLLSSCGSFKNVKGFSRGCSGCKKKQNIVNVGCENVNYATKQVTKYKKVKKMVDPGTKNGVPYEVEELVPYTETVNVQVPCTTCGSKFCPTPDCCGTISTAVLSRVTGQGASGEPFIGQIPTMKRLIE